MLDSPLYTDITPFYPITVNPFYSTAFTPEIYTLCVCMEAFGITYYLGSLGLSTCRKQKDVIKR
ncbi:MAG: hypothetical protein ACUVQ8_08140 [Nitrososphaeria archaeon]